MQWIQKNEMNIFTFCSHIGAGHCPVIAYNYKKCKEYEKKSRRGAPAGIS